MSREVMQQALEYLKDNQHHIADNERHTYVMEYNAFIDKLEAVINDHEKPAREWVGLTDEEINEIYEQHHNQYAECISTNFGYERAIETKLKEKNT